MRKTFTLPDYLAKKVEKYAKEWDISQANFMRKSIILGIFLIEEMSKGNDHLKEATEGAVKVIYLNK